MRYVVSRSSLCHFNAKGTQKKNKKGETIKILERIELPIFKKALDKVRPKEMKTLMS